MSEKEKTSISMPDKPTQSIFIDFLDPLFAVAIGIGFQNGLLYEQWLISWYWPRGQDAFNLFVFILGLLTITLSWFGYHKSIKAKPIEGNGRFILDIVLLLLYILLLFKYKNFGAVLLILAGIYFFFILWDLIKIKEHWEEYSSAGGSFLNKYVRELVTFQWFIIFSAFSFIHYFIGDSNILLVFTFIGTVLYRIDKKQHFLGKLFGWL